MSKSKIPNPESTLPSGATRKAGRFTQLVASRRFQKWAAWFPLTRRFVRSEGEAMIDLVAGFCYSQILQAIVRLDIPNALLVNEMTLDAMAETFDVPRDGMKALVSGAVSLGILRRRSTGHFGLTTRGAAMAGVPGLQGLIDHHDILYLDLADPVAFFRGQVETELADFWPEVIGAATAKKPNKAAKYSKLMTDTQTLIAEDTFAAFNFSSAHRVMDVGGGTGAFLAALGDAHPDIILSLFDLPAFVPAAEENFAIAGLRNRTEIIPGSFRDDPLPKGADLITLVRVLYDHPDEAVRDLLKSVYKALPPGGRVVVSEPMTGGRVPERAGDAYFALYCMAMRTGRARSAQAIGTLLSEAGFENIKSPRPNRPFITSVIWGERLD